MKKLLFLIFILFAQLSFSQENFSTLDETKEQAPKEEFYLNAILTMSDVDFVLKMTKDTMFFRNTQKVFRGEYFRYLPYFNSIVEKDGDSYKLECSLSLFKKGFKGGTTLIDKQVIEGDMPKKDSTLFFPQDLFVHFGETDEPGDYKVVFEVKDLFTGKNYACINEISLVEWETPDIKMSAEEISRFIFRYNTEFDKEGLYASFLSENLSFYKKNGVDGFDPLLMNFYISVFADEAFLLDILYKNFPTMTAQERKKVIMLNAFMNATPFDEKLLTSQELIFQNYMEGEFNFNRELYEDKLYMPDIEFLWGEFFARGNFRSVARMLEAFEFSTQGEYAMKVFNKDIPAPTTTQEQEYLRDGKLYLFTNNLFASYLSNPVLHGYLAWVNQFAESEKLKKGVADVLNAKESANF